MKFAYVFENNFLFWLRSVRRKRSALMNFHAFWLPFRLTIKKNTNRRKQFSFFWVASMNLSRFHIDFVFGDFRWLMWHNLTSRAHVYAVHSVLWCNECIRVRLSKKKTNYRHIIFDFDWIYVEWWVFWDLIILSGVRYFLNFFNGTD
jgi:hypothetical protein